MKTLFSIIILLFNTLAYSQSNSSYNVKFTVDTNGDLVYTNFILKVSGNEILYIKNGITKNWGIKYLGEIVHQEKQGVSFNYHRYFLSTQNKNVYISTYKNVKHNNIFYYTIIIDGQKQLAL